ncbi:stage II sporulation protein R [Salipaludibacillus neizhouensis]|uniref:Stage II sporulation protein R n=1 Tax=Salipaludibacillus neizhouensis TaxID=885475 RepID=A0A3A9KBY0_9BACI|nr:stage II sporulation protein R [Salipaludibacillus neizhouensis]RKL67991.1 stage II sporulation protein R [Salipaludibacillus neizhouensis]
MNKFLTNKQMTRLPLYIFFIITILILSWEGHFFYPQYAGASPYANADMLYGNQASEDFIPQESIRLRIKANSNSPVDQELKLNVRDKVSVEISKWTASLDDLSQARTVIESKIPEIEAVIAEEIQAIGSTSSFRVSLKNVEFPTKQYGNRLYPEGEYEAVFIEIGKGSGDNWWCVLFPPLCFVDASTDEPAETDASDSDVDEEEEVEVSFFIVDVVQSLWSKIS